MNHKQYIKEGNEKVRQSKRDEILDKASIAILLIAVTYMTIVAIGYFTK